MLGIRSIRSIAAAFYNFPVTNTNCSPIRADIQSNLFVRGRGSLRIGRSDIRTIDRKWLLDGGPCQFQQCRIPTNDVQRFVHESARLDFSFPCVGSTHPHSTFIHGAFPGTKSPVILDNSGVHTAVVTREEKQCVLQLLLSFYGSNNLANRFIHCCQHSGVALTLSSEMRIRLRIVFWNLQRTMHSIEWDIQEERLIPISFVDNPHGLICDQISGITFVVVA